MLFPKKTISDTVLIEGILAGGRQSRQHENWLYEKYIYLIREGMWKHRLQEDECSIAYSDAILTVIENIRGNRFEGRSQVKTYLYQIFNNKCVDHIRKKTTKQSSVYQADGIEKFMAILPDNTRGIVEQLADKYEIEQLERKVSELGEKCKKMILAWGEGFKDEEIAGVLGYQSASVAKTSRLRCLDRLRELYRGTPSDTSEM